MESIVAINQLVKALKRVETSVQERATSSCCVNTFFFFQAHNNRFIKVKKVIKDLVGDSKFKANKNTQCW